MKTEDGIILGLAALACWLIVKSGKAAPTWAANLGSAVYSWNEDSGTHIEPAQGVTVGSLFNTGLGGGYYTAPVGGRLFDNASIPMQPGGGY